MGAVWPILLLGVAGILAGGAVSMKRQGASLVGVGIVATLGVLAAAGGVLWLIPAG